MIELVKHPSDRGDPLLTVGHGTAGAEQLADRLRRAGAAALVDIRTAPGSRRHPQFARAELARWLPAAGVGYRWEPRLGGFRRPPAESPDRALRHPSFRGYAAWMRGPDFRRAIDELLAGGTVETTVLMCSESVWWRCHRRLVADFLVLVRTRQVRHLMPDGRLVDHPANPVARLVEGSLVYDVGQPQLPGA